MQHSKQLDIVCWAFPSWNGNYMKSTVELMKELAVNHRVLYIDYAYTIKDIVLPANDSAIPVKNIRIAQQSLQEIKLDNGGKIFVLSLPPVVPFNWTNSKAIYKLIQQFNGVLVERRIKYALRQLNFDTDVVINAFNPFFGHATHKIFGNSPVIYYCYDNMDATEWASKHGAWLEKEFMQQVNAIIFSSEALKANKAFAVPAHVVNNGVDLRIFNQLSSSETRYAGKEPKRITGYTGSIDERINFDLLEKVISDNPQMDFHFIGRVMTAKADRLKNFSNVQFFGAQKPTDMAVLMSRFDAGIIPFVKNDFTRNIYPMKVNEYLALGIPVISTGFAQLNDLAGYMEIADDAKTFSAKLNESIKLNSEQKINARKTKAYSNSWEHKASEFEHILMQYAA
jgi:glycosyltransferase involved in cell wall biosynthesis